MLFTETQSSNIDNFTPIKKSYNIFHTSCYESDGSVQELSGSILCHKIGDIVTAIISYRSPKGELTWPEGWTELFTTDDIEEDKFNNHCAVLWKKSETLTESITVTQTQSARIALTLIDCADADSVNLYGDVLYNWDADDFKFYKDIPKPKHACITCAYSECWGRGIKWKTSEGPRSYMHYANPRLNVIIGDSPDEVNHIELNQLMGERYTACFFVLTFGGIKNLGKEIEYEIK